MNHGEIFVQSFSRNCAYTFSCAISGCSIASLYFPLATIWAEKKDDKLGFALGFCHIMQNEREPWTVRMFFFFWADYLALFSLRPRRKSILYQKYKTSLMWPSNKRSCVYCRHVSSSKESKLTWKTFQLNTEKNMAKHFNGIQWTKPELNIQKSQSQRTGTLYVTS